MSKLAPVLALLCALVALPVILNAFAPGRDIAVSGQAEGSATTPTPSTTSVHPGRSSHPGRPSHPGEGRDTDDTFARQLLDITNAQRQERGLQPVVADTRLQEIAADWSAQQRGRPRLEHRDVKGQVGHGYLASYQRFGENLYKTNGYLAAADVHRAWMNSPAHRDNILDPTWNRVGFGVARHGDITYVTENFGNAR